MIDLSTAYMGLHLRNPLVVSASPLCEDLNNIRGMEDAGAAAVVLQSLFEEQITLESQDFEYYLAQGTYSFAESLTYFPDLNDYKLGPDEYLKHIRKAKEAVDIPIIGSLNGISTGGWIRYAKAIEDAGADALELNIYYIPTDLNTSSEQVEGRYIDLVRSVKTGVNIPVAVKLSPYFSSTAHMAHRLDQVGANALVLFNRFYQPDLDIENLEVVPNLVLSTSDELRLRLRWIAILYGKIQADMAITGGIHSAADVVKTMMIGARVAMMASALLKNGIPYLERVLKDVFSWMEEHGFGSIRQMQGIMSQRSVAEPAAFERANYIQTLHSYR